jgi:uncharacterized membrane protein/thiol-disulfide isomerase/thioredoxin
MTRLLFSLLVLPLWLTSFQAPQSVVRAVLYYSPHCGHCHTVIEEVLPPLLERYGAQLEILRVDVTEPLGAAQFQAAVEKFRLPSAGVPLLVIGDEYLIGSVDIPGKFPALIEKYLAQGGVDWPDLPGLDLQPQNTPTAAAPTAMPVVRTLLFYRSACSHCQKVTAEVIPPLLEKYGAQLEIFGVDVSLPEGDALYDAAIAHYQIKVLGVPTLIVDRQVLVGGLEIQEKFPGLVEEKLSQGGTDWPDLPGLPEVISTGLHPPVTPAATLQTTPVAPSQSTLTPIAEITRMESKPPNWRVQFARDPLGNAFSVIALIGMFGAILWAAAVFKTTIALAEKESWPWATPLLCLIGLGVAGYLAYVETTQVAAVCGPVGDCNTVQQSEYARLFGILPIGVLGLAGYLFILLAWRLGRLDREPLSSYARLAFLAMTAFGLAFSIYLTFLEPFVIGATCAWCLTSAAVMTLLFLLSLKPGKRAYLSIFH